MGKIDFRDPNVQIAGVVIFASLMIVYVFFFASFLPFGHKVRGAEIAKLEAEYEIISADVMKAKQTASRLPQVKAEYESLSERWEEAKTLLPTDQEMADLLTQVTVAGQRSGVDFLLFQPQPVTPREVYTENPIDVSVQGGYHNIGAFLSRVGNLSRIVNVRSIDLKNVTNPADKDGADLVEAKVQLAAYTLMPGNQPAATEETPAQPAPNQKPNGGKRRGH